MALDDEIRERAASDVAFVLPARADDLTRLNTLAAGG